MSVNFDSLENILDNIDAYIYVSNGKTGELLFVNRQLRKFFGREHDNFVGKICWEEFRGVDKKCDFCPCYALDDNPDETIVWEERFLESGKYLMHSDCLIDWPGGIKVHLQHAVDITALKETTTKLDRRLEQQSLMTVISQKFFSGENLDTLLTEVLQEIGVFMRISQILIYKVSDDELTLYCQHGWLDPKCGLPSRVGGTIVISETMRDIFRSLGGRSRTYVTNDDPDVEAAMSPYRKNFQNYLTTGIFIGGKLYAVLDFARPNGEIWSHNEIQIATFLTNILAGIFQKHEVEEQLIRAKEAAEQNSSYKSSFLASMSHEIRTPMNAIIGMTELAMRETDPNAKNEHIYTVNQAASNLLAIINDILDFSKIEAGKMEIIPANYSVSTFLNDVVSIIRMRVIDSQIRFAVKVDSNIPRKLIGDETRIRQAVLNLLSNAVKYTERGFVTFGMYMEPRGESVPFVSSDNTVNLVFEVTDTGIGIRKEDFGKLFNDFTRLDSERNKGTEGVGLGLAITRNIVEAMGGSINVESEYGKGSTFTIRLPQKYDLRIPLAKINMPNPEKVIILIHERRSVSAEALEYTLKNLGVDCTIVTTTTDLFQQMVSRQYSFLFIPYMIYERNEQTISKYKKKTKIVILSDFGDSVPEKDMYILSMPAYCTHIADLFNGVNNRVPQGSSTISSVRFSAPSAKVLVVDDIRTNLKVAEGLLIPYKIRVDLCSGGLSSIEMVSSALSGGDPYDLILMDHKMPGVDGMEATQRIRAAEGSAYFKNVPIVALTANAVSGTEELFLSNGFSDFLAKPVETVKLNAMLEKWIPKEKQEKIYR